MTATAAAPPRKSLAAPGRTPARWRRPLWALFTVSLVLGSIGLWLRITEGHLPAGYGSYVPWGLWVAVYFHAVGIAAGAIGLSAIGHLFGVEGFRSRRSLRVAAVLATAGIGAGLLAVGLDLGKVSRAWRVVLTPSFTSLIAFNTWTYLALLVVCLAIWVLSFRPDRGWLKPVLILAVLLSVMAAGQSGAFLGVVAAEPSWHGGLLPILTLVSAITAGAGALLVVRTVVAASESGEADVDQPAVDRTLRRVLLAGLAAYFVLEFGEFSIALWGDADGSPELSVLFTGPYWWVFWIVHVGLGGILSAALLLTRRHSAWVVAGGIVGVTFVSGRLNILVPAQAVAPLEGLEEAFFHPRLTYLYEATAMEYLVSFFVLAFGMAVLHVGIRLSRAAESRTTVKEVPHGAR